MIEANPIYDNGTNRIFFLRFSPTIMELLKKFTKNDLIVIFDCYEDFNKDSLVECSVMSGLEFNTARFVDKTLDGFVSVNFYAYENWNSYPYELKNYDNILKYNIKLRSDCDPIPREEIKTLAQMINRKVDFEFGLDFYEYLCVNFINKFLYSMTPSTLEKLIRPDGLNYYSYVPAPKRRDGILLKDVYLTPEGVAFDYGMNDDDFRDINYDYFLWESFFKRSPTRADYLDSVRNNTITELDDNAIYVNLCHSLGYYVYGHFFDIFGKLTKIVNNDVIYLVNLDARNRISDFNDQLDKCGLKSEKIFLVKRESLLKIKNLMTIPIQSYPSQLNKNMQYFFIDKYFVKSESNKDVSRIYMTRNSNNNKLQMVGSRNILNEDEVVEFLKARGFLIIDGSENINYLIEIFSRCQVLVSMHGSGIRNMMFSRIPNYIIEIYPKNFKTENGKPPDSTIANLCSTKNSIYKQLLVDGDSKFNVEIDLRNLEKHLSPFI